MIADQSHDMTLIATARRRAALAFGLGVVLFLIGAYLVAKAGSSTSGSPLGWVFVALGVISVFVCVGFLAGAYEP